MQMKKIFKKIKIPNNYIHTYYLNNNMNLELFDYLKSDLNDGNDNLIWVLGNTLTTNVK
jgi:hypothetical protein